MVEPAVATPGSSISVHGEFLWTEAIVEVFLLGADGATVDLGSVVTQPDGSLEYATRLPADVAGGPYRVVARLDANESIDVELIVDTGMPVIPIVTGLLAAVMVAGAVFARRRGRAA